MDDHHDVGHAVATGQLRADHDPINRSERLDREGSEMDAYFTQELTRQHQADLLREADRGRLARIAREGGEVDFGGSNHNGRVRLILALGGAAAGILATAATVIAH
jgi:hypothetical protein